MAADTGAATVTSVVGVAELSKHAYPQIAAVGMAAAPGREPRIVDIRWDAPAAAAAGGAGGAGEVKEVVIVGKGVVFDTG